MMTRRASCAVWVSLVLGMSVPAYAQATRTWVSGVGDDVNPCSRTAPCKTFAGAISKTAAGGEIDVLDPGGFGAVTITKSISIESDGAIAGVLASGTNGIVVNAAATDVVVIRGLIIEGVGTGLNGIRFLAGGALYVENCTINNFTQKGIDFEPSGSAQLLVTNTIIRNNANLTTGGGIFIKPGLGASVSAQLDGVLMERNAVGLRAEDNSAVAMTHSVAGGNLRNGVIAFSASAATQISVTDSLVANNGTNGIKSEGVFSTVRLNRVTTTGNGTGISSLSGGAIVSFGNNANDGNTVNGAPTSTIALQ